MMKPTPKSFTVERSGWSSILSKAPDGKKVLALFIVSNLVYVLMLTVTIPQVQQYSGGLLPFDIMPTGYGIDYAQTFLDSLGEEGRHYYLTRQLALDMIYPALYALAGAAVWLWLLGKFQSRTAFPSWICVLPLISGAADYIENGLVITLLMHFPTISPSIVWLSSVSTVFKSGVMMFFALLLILLVLSIGLRRLSNGGA
ncbi:hypothetical protein [Hoeflea alexandrii]|uniref:Integron gene cassette protein n=2 Tax=Rhizobiaceae TaxID=82115 RepID=A0ABT1CSL2_9HYPH|nr:hypothetical protein [Hoeflea alexandrii]